MWTEASLLLIIIYAIIVVSCFGLQDSFSASYKEVGNWFTVWCISVGILLFIGLVKENPIVLFPTFGFIVVGLAPKFDEWQKPIHYLGALFIILGGCGVIAYEKFWYGLIALGIIASFTLLTRKIKRKILWLEIISIITIYSFILIK